MGALDAVVWPKHLRHSLTLCVNLGYFDGREWRFSMRRGERDMSVWVICAQS
jgi:hypothetical protein